MTAQIINGIIKNGKIIPQNTLPKTHGDVKVKIMILPQNYPEKNREKYRGSVPGGWGDPMKYQKKIRKELER